MLTHSCVPGKIQKKSSLNLNGGLVPKMFYPFCCCIEIKGYKPCASIFPCLRCPIPWCRISAALPQVRTFSLRHCSTPSTSPRSSVSLAGDSTSPLPSLSSVTKRLPRRRLKVRRDLVIFAVCLGVFLLLLLLFFLGGGGGEWGGGGGGGGGGGVVRLHFINQTSLY